MEFYESSRLVVQGCELLERFTDCDYVLGRTDDGRATGGDLASAESAAVPSPFLAARGLDDYATHRLRCRGEDVTSVLPAAIHRRPD
jgi:hypothetical protein